MWSEYRYVKVQEVLSRILRHPLLSDLNLEAAIQFALDFIGIMGLPDTYMDKYEVVKIKDYRGKLPCDCVSINQVRKKDNNIILRSMTDNFNDGCHRDRGEYTFKTQGSVIFTSFKDGDIEISYKAIPTDEDGLPLLPDNAVFLKTLELYIKKEWFTILFDMGRISNAVLQNTQQEYSFKAGQCNNEFMIPSVSEMQTLTNMWNRLVPDTTAFYKGFKHEGDMEHIKLQ